jgi:hypothetical protein
VGQGKKDDRERADGSGCFTVSQGAIAVVRSDEKEMEADITHTHTHTHMYKMD